MKRSGPRLPLPCGDAPSLARTQNLVPAGISARGLRGTSPALAAIFGLAEIVALLASGVAAAGCAARETGLARRRVRETELETRLRDAVADLPAGVEVGLAALDLSGGDSILIGAHEPMHAASTMKVGVLIELYRGADESRWKLADSLRIENRFRSIADGSPYVLDIADDSDSLPYARIGRRASLAWLAERMVTVSSNLATNLLVELVVPDSVNATLARLGAGEMRVLRGVEDGPAFERGLNNTTTAYGFARVLAAIARAERGEEVPGVSPAGARAMVEILARQTFNQGIPAGVPPGVRIAHKTGSITGVEHDGGVVYPPGQDPYVLVVLTRGFRRPSAARRAMARLSRIVWEVWGAAE